jgi:hypothetical protein
MVKGGGEEIHQIEGRKDGAIRIPLLHNREFKWYRGYKVYLIEASMSRR